MMKKIFAFIVLFSGILGIISCGDCFKSTSWNITGVEISFEDTNSRPLDIDSTFTGDSLIIALDFQPVFVENFYFKSNPFIESAFATTCEPKGGDGLEEKVDSFKIISSTKFNDFESGESLNSIIKLGNNDTIEEWIGRSESWVYEYMPRVGLIVTEKPINQTEHIFTIEIELESGEIITVDSDLIKWN